LAGLFTICIPFECLSCYFKEGKETICGFGDELI
jgi:hypothetical protein